MGKYWKVKKVNTSDDGEKVISVCLRDAINNSYDISFKWDGCIDMFKYSNGFTPEDDDNITEEEEAENSIDYIHICDIDEMIERLQELKEIMKNFY